MTKILITVQEVGLLLKRLNQAGLRSLSNASGVSFISLMRIRQGTCKNPGLVTVGAFMPHIAAVSALAAYQSREYSKQLAAEFEAAAAASTSTAGADAQTTAVEGV